MSKNKIKQPDYIKEAAQLKRDNPNYTHKEALVLAKAKLDIK